MKDIRMALKTLQKKKKTSKHLHQGKVSGHAARLATCLFILTV